MNRVLVDLRSDTVTRPTAAMREAMAAAEVGDAGFGEDPTLSRLEADVAALLERAGAVFVPSGTMANQVALRVVADRPGLVVAGRRQHVVMSEAGAAGANGVGQIHAVDDADGTLDREATLDALAGRIGPSPEVVAVTAENTHAMSGGRIWDDTAWQWLLDLGPPVHLDGARLFNAAVAAGRDPAQLSRGATTVACCLSKALGAPVGSLVAGDADAVARARLERQRLGGTMRQAGVLAAAGLVALRDWQVRLAVDHERARGIGDAVRRRWPDTAVPVVTNIVLFAPRDREAVLAHLAQADVGALAIGRDQIRMVTHGDVGDEGVERVNAAIADAPD